MNVQDTVPAGEDTTSAALIDAATAALARRNRDVPDLSHGVSSISNVGGVYRPMAAGSMSLAQPPVTLI